MNATANTGSVLSTFRGAEEARDCAMSDEPTAAEWAAMQDAEDAEIAFYEARAAAAFAEYLTDAAADRTERMAA